MQQLQTHCVHLQGHCIHHDNIHPHCMSTEPHSGTLHPDELTLQVQCNECRITASSFMGTACYFTTYCIHLGSHCRGCMVPASTFRDTAVGSATPSATLHPAAVAMKVHCNHSLFTTSTGCSLPPHSVTLQGALQPLQDHCFQLNGLCHYR